LLIESPDEAHDVPDGGAALSARAEGEAAADEGGDAAGHENASAAEAAAEGSVEEAPGEKGDKAAVDVNHVGGISCVKVFLSIECHSVCDFTCNRVSSAWLVSDPGQIVRVAEGEDSQVDHESEEQGGACERAAAGDNDSSRAHALDHAEHGLGICFLESVHLNKDI